RINVEFRQSYKFIAGAKVEMGREYFRSGGIGFTSGVLDLVLTKNRDAGTVTLCSDYNFPFANVDVGLGPVGAGFSLGAPGPTKSGPAITMRASGKLGILGVSFGAISADKICVDPETFQ